jgi:hypothetical protein
MPLPPRYLGEGRFNQVYPLASILWHGGKVTLGSDYPLSWIGEDALNPMFNIEMAVTRQLPVFFWLNGGFAGCRIARCRQAAGATKPCEICTASKIIGLGACFS